MLNKLNEISDSMRAHAALDVARHAAGLALR